MRSPNCLFAAMVLYFAESRYASRRRRRRQGIIVGLVAALMLSELDCVVFEFCYGGLVGILVFSPKRDLVYGIAWTGTSRILLGRDKGARMQEGVWPSTMVQSRIRFGAVGTLLSCWGLYRRVFCVKGESWRFRTCCL
jgi:hypothetical protein